MQKLFLQSTQTTVDLPPGSKETIAFGYGVNFQFTMPCLMARWGMSDTLFISVQSDRPGDENNPLVRAVLNTLVEEVIGDVGGNPDCVIPPSDPRWLSAEQFRQKLLELGYEEISP